MKVSTIGFNGVTFTFNPKVTPLTTDMKKLITGEFTKMTPSLAKQVMKVEITRGEPSPHISCKKRFAKPLSHEEQGYCIKPRRNAGRKPKGKKPARTTIRKLFTTH